MLEELNWTELLARLTAYAMRRLNRFGVGNIADAEQLAQEAVRRLLDPEYAAELDAFEDERALLWQLQSAINGLVNNHQRKRGTRAELAWDPADLPRHTAAGGEGYHVDKLDGERVLERLRARVAERDEVVVGLIELYALKPHEQAEYLGLPVSEIYNARRRLKDHIEAVRRELLEGNDV